MNNSDYVYKGIVKNISLAFELEMQRMACIYNFDIGDEFEIAICSLLKKVLPRKYGVCRGFVIDKDGTSAGDDIIIYDKESFPVLRFLEGENDFSHKQQIPVDAVYAYIEAKHNLDEKTLPKAFEQVIKVKKLCYRRNPHVVSVHAVKGKKIFDEKYAEQHGGDPIILNPMYAMILARNSTCSGTKSAAEQTHNWLHEQLNGPLCDTIKNNSFYCPDSIVAGPDVFAVSAHHLFDENNKKEEGVLITKFYTGISSKSCYQVNIHEQLSYGLAFAHLMLALNFIKLKEMPWAQIFNTAKMPDIDKRNYFFYKIFPLEK